ncbi:MAG: hypothetical protein A2939_03940 [Parcubacteria group bacterium RIFCSPLOWO2_01_FULL_48_18]|nr:MAG: hypothetical protein A2939_03940 [Parcubacteria group bacterium RIFCSPLOWO2_01_FULL_48_18]
MPLPLLQSLRTSKFVRRLLPTSYVGVDIGTTTIKMVEMLREGNQFRLRNYGMLESFGHLSRMSGVIQSASMKLVDTETVELLRVLLKRVKPSSKIAIASLPNFSGFMTLLELPEMHPDELTQAIGFQAREHIPLPLEEAFIDWSSVGTVSDGNLTKQLILLIAVPMDAVHNYQTIFNEVGLKLIAVELDSVSLVRAAIQNDPTPTVIADIGSQTTTVIVADQGFLRLTFNSETAGSDLTTSISNSLTLGPRRSEEMKKTRGLVNRSGEEELSTLMLPLIDVIINEVRRGIETYEEKYKTKVERVMLAGGTANLPNIEEYFSSQLRLPVVKINPFGHMSYPTELAPITKELGPLLSVSIGLAMKDNL